MFLSINNLRPVGGVLFSEVKSSEGENKAEKIRIYRSGRLDNATREDLDALSEKLGIKSVIDLRSFNHEYQNNGSVKLLDGNNQDVQVLDIYKMERTLSTVLMWTKRSKRRDVIQHFMVNFFEKQFVERLFYSGTLSIFQQLKILVLWFCTNFVGTGGVWKYVLYLIQTQGMFSFYKMTLDFCGVSIRSSFQLLNNESNLPAIVCCHAGKDRTGIISALLLAMCGFDRKIIVDDYNLTETALPSDHKELVRYADNMKGAPGHIMTQLLHYIDEKYGSVPEYLVSIGFSVEEQENLKQLIVC